MKLSELLKQVFESAASSAIANQALEFAKEKHEGQKRKGKSNDDYIIHPKRVAKYVSKYSKSPQVIAAALTHDTVEDTNTTIHEIAEKFGDLVASLVNELTSDKTEIKKQGKTKYLINKMKKMSNEGLLIKLCDRLDNCSDLQNLDEKFKNKYTTETIDILNELQRSRKLTDSQQKIVNLIKKKIYKLYVI